MSNISAYLILILTFKVSTSNSSPRDLHDSAYSMDPHFRHLTHSNIPASDAEALQIRELISMERRNISILEEQIRVANSQRSEFQPVNPSLSSQREEYYDRLRRYESTVSIIRRVPAEIFVEIFLLYCLEPASLPLLCTEPRLVVTRICSRWRSIALDLQNLWNRVSLTSSAHESSIYTSIKFLDIFDAMDTTHISRLPRRYEEKNKKIVGIVEEWFRRAWSVPLEVNLQYPSSIFSPELVIRDIVIPNSRRFRSIEMHIPQDTVQFFMGSSSIMFDSLETLQIFVTKSSPKAPSWAGIAVPHSAPKLRCLGFEIPRGFDSSLITFPSSKLTSLRLRCAFVPVCMSVLAECPKLIECKLHISDDSDISVTTSWDSIITLPHLRLFDLDTSMYESLFQYLCLPALEDLSIPLSENADTFLALASRSRFTLIKLSVNSEPESLSSDGADALETILHWTPCLLSLQLVGIPSEEVLEMIGCYQLVSKLRIFEIICVGGGRRGWSSLAVMNGFIDMIDARRPREGTCDDSSLRKVLITQSPSKDLAQFLPIEKWRRDGLAIDVRHAPSKS